MELFQHVSLHPDAQESDELNALQERSQGTILQSLQIEKLLMDSHNKLPSFTPYPNSTILLSSNGNLFYTHQISIERKLRDAKTIQIFDGTNQIQMVLWLGPCFPENRDLRIGKNFYISHGYPFVTDQTI